MNTAEFHHLQLRGFLAETRTQFPITLAYLFGSQATGQANARSDYDVAVLFEGSVSADDRHLLAHQLTELLEADVDLVDLALAPVELVYNVITAGHVLYEKDQETREEFEERSMSLYFEQLPILRAKRESLLDETQEDYAAGVERYRTALGETERMLAQVRAAQDQDK